MNERLTIDRPNLSKRLHDDYCDSLLVQTTEDVLTLRDISRIAKDQGVAWHNVKNEDEVLDRFWEIVEIEHWDGL
jgi:hypothetical protein